MAKEKRIIEKKSELLDRSYIAGPSLSSDDCYLLKLVRILQVVLSIRNGKTTAVNLKQTRKSSVERDRQDQYKNTMTEGTSIVHRTRLEDERNAPLKMTKAKKNE